MTQRHFFHWFWEGQRASKQGCPGQPGTAQSQHSRARAHWLGRRQEPAWSRAEQDKLNAMQTQPALHGSPHGTRPEDRGTAGVQHSWPNHRLCREVRQTCKMENEGPKIDTQRGWKRHRMGQNRASAAVQGDQGEQRGCEHGFQAGCVNLLLTEPGCSLGAGAGEQGTRGKAPREGPPDAGTQARPRVFALPVSVLT